MIDVSNTSFNPSNFILVGIPGLEASHIWISIPLCLFYLIAVLGNCAILLIIKTEPSLHTPMYYFLSMLAVNDVGMSLTTLPTMLSVFWFNSTILDFDACLTQMFFLHSFSFMESSILFAMAFDRFIAICNPLRYATILTNPVIAKIGVAIVIKGISVVIPVVFLLKRLPFCKTNLLSHSFCFHPDMLKLVCADTKINNIYGLFVVVATAGVDSVCIALSYVRILMTVLRIASWEGRLKAFNTCVSHICAVLIFYIPMIGLSVVHRFGRNAPPALYTLMGNVYLLITPVLNPIIYSVKTKQIQRAVLRILCARRRQTSPRQAL
ncbi:olfactory receptor 51G2-like [Rhinatrema bivittatum]|uniref:olfactory receptor 51G2-like n=1 Tax=Rhinatrema bivittatum TaxID=194408 RepID=UPI00112B00E6|nr:olfactory receptor 51G2-like [Rhinatrema bivittatum]